MFQIGQILDDRYQLVEPLKMAEARQIWRSIDLNSRTACVIKLIGFHSTLKWQDYEQFEREITILKHLKDDRIPCYLNHFDLEVEGMHWSASVQAEISGTSLQSLLDQQYRFSTAEIRQIAIELLQILVDLHGQFPPVLHRKIKPGHVMLSSDRSVYLIGFGAAGTICHGSLYEDTGDCPFTGTYGYAPPEQLSGQAMPASDLYALGATILHLLTGLCPADLPQYSEFHHFCSIASIDDRFAKWLTKMLQPDIDRRFQTAKQALASLLETESDTTASQFPEGVIVHNSIVHDSAVSHAVSPVTPGSDRIKIDSLPQQIQITIAKRGIRLADALWLGTGALTGGVSVLMLFSHVHPALSVLCWLDSLPLLGIGLLSALGEAALTVRAANGNLANAHPSNPETVLSHPSVSIQWKCLGIPYRKIQESGAIVAIDRAGAGITIQTKNQQYGVGQFSPSLSEAESQGLVRGVKEWMGGGVDE